MADSRSRIVPGMRLPWAKHDLESAQKRWRYSGPLSEEWMKLLIDWRELHLPDRPTELVWAAFVRSLTPDQKDALNELVQGEEKADSLF